MTHGRLPQPTSTDPLPGIPSREGNECQCGPDADLDALRDWMRKGWTQHDASYLLWSPGPMARYTDALADYIRAVELVSELLAESDRT